MTTLDARPTAGAPTVACAAARERVHIVTWRLLDYVGRDLTYGGLQRWLLALIDLLRDDHHPVTVHQRADSPFERDLAEGVTVIGHPAAARSYATPRFNRRAHRAIPTDAPVVYMAEDVAFPICRPRSVVVQHGIWWDGELGRLKLRIAERLVRRVVRRSAATICVDTNFINWFRARWPAPASATAAATKLHFVPNFLDPAQWGPQPEVPAAARRRDGRLTVCFPRRSEPRRGVLLMADVAPDLLRAHPEVDFRFVVGSGFHTEALRQRLVATGIDAARWPIEVLPFEQMRAAYTDSAIVTIPTLCGEGTSLSAIEAMYFGCAVVSTWVGGLPNLIQDDRNGLLIPPDASALSAALSRLITDEALRVRLGTTAMGDILPRHGVDRWRERVAAVLGSALNLPQEVRA